MFNAPAPAGGDGEKPAKKKNKYGVRIDKAGKDARAYNGVQFDSLREMNRYKELVWLEKAGKISDIRLQVRYKFVHNDVLIGAYVADFVYLRDGKEVVEDAKGVKTAYYKLKKKMMLAFYDIQINEV